MAKFDALPNSLFEGVDRAEVLQRLLKNLGLADTGLDNELMTLDTGLENSAMAAEEQEAGTYCNYQQG